MTTSLTTPMTSTSTAPGNVASSALNLTKTYGRTRVVRVLDGISVNVRRGELTAITGPAEAGKTTLMHCLAGLERPTGGRIFLAGRELSQLRTRALVRATAGRVSFVVQPPRLLPDWSVLQNILLPLDLSDGHADHDRLHAVVASLDLAHLLAQPARSLTTVQQQRVAIGRSAIIAPEIIFADIPVGSLDASSARDLPIALRTLSHDLGQTVILATRNTAITGIADRTLVIDHGRLIDDVRRP